jgi:hypothetical protein
VIATVATVLFISAGLLVVSGLAKLGNPRPAETALSNAGLPHRSPIARVLGIVEILVGTLCLFHPAIPVAAAVGLLYAGFTAFLLRLVRSGASAGGCGCLGERSVPPGRLHLTMSVAAAASGFAAAALGVPNLPALAGRTPAFGVPYLAGAAVAGYLAYFAVAYLPEIFFSYRGRIEGNRPR